MNYIYDILINFKYPLFDFYEWNKNDDIMNIRKIPLYRISRLDLECFKNNSFEILSILDEIKNKTIVYSNHKRKIIEYACILSDGVESIGLIFDKNGKCIGKSKLLIDEELEVLSIINKIEIKFIDYKVLKEDKIDYYKTCKELDTKNYLLREINKINDLDKLNYLYYECFNMFSDNPKEDIINSLDTNWDLVNNKIYDFLQLFPMNK